MKISWDYESPWFVISAHRTPEGADKAVAFDKHRMYNEWQDKIKEHVDELNISKEEAERKRPFVESDEGWDIKEFELLD